MKKTIWARLVICYLIISVSFFVLLNTYGMNILEKRLKNDKFEQMYQEAQLISNEYMNYFFNDKITLESLATQLRSIDTFLDMRIWIVNPDGTIISDTSHSKNARNVNINELNPNFLENITSEYTFFRAYFDEPMISFTQPVTYNYKVRGYIVLHTPLTFLEKEANRYLDMINICFLIFLPILFIVFLYIHAVTGIPMQRLMKAAMEYSSGNYNYTLNLKGLSEYQNLGAAISYMASEISKLEDYQKKFVANISHDFRSPLTSIKGYAEAIKDGTIPHDMQDKYLNIILFETERLNKLTSSLLELNSFESHGTFLDIVSFDINHIIKKTAESFEGACRNKKITLNLVFSSKKTYVDADMGKIQQVLYNLIDKPQIQPYELQNQSFYGRKGEKVFVSVKDYGAGIPKESLKKIWDRFYKTDPSRGKDKRGTGLGLSITKEIIQAHNENINVISTEGVGSEFIFSLTKSGK